MVSLYRQGVETITECSWN